MKIARFTIHCVGEGIHVGPVLCVVYFEGLVLRNEYIHGCRNGECKPLTSASMASAFILFVLKVVAGVIHPVAGNIHFIAGEIHSDEIAIGLVDEIAFINLKLETSQDNVGNIDFDFNTIVARLAPDGFPWIKEDLSLTAKCFPWDRNLIGRYAINFS